MDIKIKSLPTFRVYVNQEQVGEMAGTKLSDLRKIVDTQLAALSH